MHDRTIWIVRHGIRQDMVDATWSEGQARPYDPPLAAQGHRQAGDVGKRLCGEPIDHVFASPFTRAMQTASAIAPGLEHKIKVDPALCEALYPEWFPTDPDLHGQVELARAFEHVDSDHEPRAPVSYSESRGELRARMRGLVDDLIARYEGNLLIVGHGGSIHGLCMELVGEDQSVHTCCCCLIEISRNGKGWELHRDGTDTSHLSITEESLH
jgi:transcription factor C subunit 7